MDDFEIDWSTAGIIRRRDTFHAASQRAFMPYKTPLIFSKGERHERRIGLITAYERDGVLPAFPDVPGAADVTNAVDTNRDA